MTLSQRINFNVVPSDGFYFKDSDGTAFHGHSWIEVSKRVKRYRLRNKLPLGDPDAEVAAQACARNPSLCMPDKPVTSGRPSRRGFEKAPPPPRASLKSKTFGWLRSILRIRQEHDDKLNYVSEQTQKDRLEVCRKCPRQTEVPGGCASCAKAYSNLREQVLGKRPFLNKQISCSVLGADIPTMAWLDEVTVENSELPDFCWRKRTL